MLREWLRFPSPDGHESEETLLLFIDGALEPREDERIARHLRECWQCRATKDRMEGAIAAFMQERRHSLPEAEPELETRFRRRLEREAATPPPHRLSPSAVIRRVVWPLAAAAAAIAAVGRWEPGQRFVVDLLAPATRPAVRMASIPSPTLARPAAPPALRKALPEIEPAPLLARKPDAAELAAYLALEDLQLCCGSEATVHREEDGTVRVKGVVSTRDVGERLAERMSGFPEVRVEVSAADELPPTVEAQGTATVVLAARPPLLEKRLKEFFRQRYGPEQAGKELAAYASRSIGLAQAAQAEARTLRVLASAFPASRVRGLGAEEQRRFAGLVRRHGARLEEHLRALESQWEPLLNDETAPLAPAEERERLAVQNLETRTARISELAEALFAGLEMVGAEAEQCWLEIRQLTRQLNEWQRMSAAADLAAWVGPAGEHSLMRESEKE